MVPSPKVVAFAQAISKAEGFPVEGSLPQRCHNPGDLEIGDVGCGMEQGKTIFPNDEAGWMALYHQVTLMLCGLSHIYRPEMNFLDVAIKYTGNDNAQAWAAIVAHDLGVSIATPLRSFQEV